MPRKRKVAEATEDETPQTPRFFDADGNTTNTGRVTRSQTAGKRKLQAVLSGENSNTETSGREYAAEVLGSEDTGVQSRWSRPSVASEQESSTRSVSSLTTAQRIRKRQNAREQRQNAREAQNANVTREQNDIGDERDEAIGALATSKIEPPQKKKNKGNETNGNKLAARNNDNDESRNGPQTRSQAGQTGDSPAESQSNPNPEIIVRSEVPRPRKKQRNVTPASRRSARLMKPATSFERRFNLLPGELEKMVWEMAIEDATIARCVYIRNPSNRNATFLPGVRNALPTLFRTCIESRRMINRDYKLLFARMITIFHPGPAIRLPIQTDLPELFRNDGRSQQPANQSLSHLVHTNASGGPVRLDLHDLYNWGEAQLVNPNRDVVVFEACCLGCRASHCSRYNYRPADLAQVRFLAIQQGYIFPSHMVKVWEHISKAWTSVEILYIIQNTPNYNASGLVDWAMIRRRRSLEEDLHKQFVLWKNGDPARGKPPAVTTIRELEFVEIHNRRPLQKGQAHGDQYAGLAVATRATGTVADIIIG